MDHTNTKPVLQAAFIVHLLSLLSFANATYVFLRKRYYRLFEAPIDECPSTPSAQRVRVDSSPLSSSPFRLLSSILSVDTAQARSHPVASRDVWEVSVWDPTPLSLKMFCLFSPGHVLVYWLFLPTALQDPRPSTTVVTTIALVGLLSLQLTFLQMNFSQQSKDTAVIHKEVLNEYDIKYVHPRTQPLTRDVGTQFYDSSGTSVDDAPEYEDENNIVETYTPTIIINRGFHTQPNANYIKHIDPEGARQQPRPSLFRDLPNPNASVHTPDHLRDMSSPLQPQTAMRQPQFRASAGPGGGDGGNLGIYSHARSPLRKAVSTHFVGAPGERERSRSPLKRETSPFKREGSPLKQRTSVPGGLNGLAAGQRFAHLREPSTRRESGRF